MSRLPYPEISQLPPSVRGMVEARSANITRMLAVASEGVFHSTLALLMAFIEGSPLSARIREIAILRTDALSNARYGLFQHESLARYIGMTEAEIAAAKEGGAAAEMLGPDGEAVVTFVDDLVRNMRPSDEQLAKLRRYMSDTEVVDLTLLVGSTMMMACFMETTGVEIDSASMDWEAFDVPSAT